MRKIKILFIALTLCILLLLTGCEDYGVSYTKEFSGFAPQITIYGEPFNTDALYFLYAVDERTDIVYIIGASYKKGFMSVALNSDGTPMTKNQLEEMMIKGDV